MVFKTSVWILTFGFLVSSSAIAREWSYNFVNKKQEEKKQTYKGWNLADWIVQRDQMRSRDLWLAMHTPTPYEFFFGGDYQILATPKDQRNHRFQFGAFAKIFGLTFEKESRNGRFNAFLNFRLYGLYQQGTNLTLFGGLRSQSKPETFRSAVAGLSGNLYLTRYFGFEASYRKYFQGTSDAVGFGRSGNELESNLFIDFNFLRLYGGLIRTEFQPSVEKGYQFGARFFF